MSADGADTPRPPRRVILVGRTGLDQSLRRDRSVELIRAADSIDAVGELADPIDADSPTSAVVVMAPDAEPEGPERGAFLDAVRSINPDVAVLIATTEGHPDGYDGVVDPNGTDGDFARVLDAVFAARQQPAEAWPDATPARPARSGAPSEDAGVVEVLLAGRDPTDAAMSAIRARLGRDDVGFSQGADTPRAGLTRPVRAGDAVLGHIVVHHATPEDAGDAKFSDTLAREADWLSGWLRLYEQQRQLRQAAFTDPLSGAWNRRYFDRYLDAALDQVRGARLPMTVMVFDIDNFKAYNDAYGHAAGDEILVETVRLLNSTIRPSDRVCRIGGDEFAVVFYEPSGPRSAASKPPESVYTIARRFQQQICEHRFPKLGAEAQGTLTISGGLATYPWDGTDAQSLLARADELAMRSKKQGKNALTLGPGAESVCKPKD
ncbi:MAG: GGDEF domain-containing protein [Phycisphaerales bacterium]